MSAVAPVRAVLFDLDGTLLDTLPDLVHALNAALVSTGRSTITRDFLLPAVSAGTRSMLARAAPDASADENDLLRERFLAHYEESLGAYTATFDGMDVLLESLQRQQIRCGVVTNKLERYTRPLLSKLGMCEQFECVICGDTTTAPKPSPLPLLAAIDTLNLSPEQVVYIGDSPGDVQAANAATVPVLIAGWGYVDPDDDPQSWGEAALIGSPPEVGDWLERRSDSCG